MALVTIKMRRTVNEPGGRLMFWLVRPESEDLLVHQHNVEGDWAGVRLLRDVCRFGQLFDELAGSAAEMALSLDQLRQVAAKF